MDERNNDFDFDFTPIGQAIKKVRTAMESALKVSKHLIYTKSIQTISVNKCPFYRTVHMV